MEVEITQVLRDYMREHKFTREKFIDQIRMMNKVHVETGSRITLNKLKANKIKLTSENLDGCADEQLAKVHKVFLGRSIDRLGVFALLSKNRLKKLESYPFT